MCILKSNRDIKCQVGAKKLKKKLTHLSMSTSLFYRVSQKEWQQLKHIFVLAHMAAVGGQFSRSGGQKQEAEARSTFIHMFLQTFVLIEVHTDGHSY